MENKCLFCDKQRYLKSFDSQKLNICEKIEEIFNIRLNEYGTISKFYICNHCIINVNSSYDFYHRIKNARDQLSNINTVVVKIEVKEEIYENLYDEFSITQPFDSPVSENESVFGIIEEIKNPEKKRKYNKIPPELRKKNRGIRRAKESVRITTKKLYEKKELKGLFTDTREFLQIFEEDKLKDGKISSRALELYTPSAWSKNKWLCNECSNEKSFSNIMDLNEHLHKVHKTKFRRNCEQCARPAQNFAAYLNHVIENHVSNNKFCCILCTEPEFRWNLRDLYFHYQKQHSKKKIIFCIYCGFHFICGAKLKEHLISKHKRENDEGEQFQCDFCGWKTELRHRMKNHMVKHVREPIFMCDQCTLTFASAAYLSTHIKQVHSKLEIGCTKCEKLFKSERRLRVHDRAVHQDNKQFVCHICQKGFHAQYRLNSHLRIHADAKAEKFQCTYCERKFKYKPGMIYHIRAAHTGERPFSCPIEGCPERFFDYSNARKHISGSHNSPLKPIRE